MLAASASAVPPLRVALPCQLQVIVTPVVSSPEHVGVCVPQLPYCFTIRRMLEHRGHVSPSSPIDLQVSPTMGSPTTQKSVFFAHGARLPVPHRKNPSW